MIQQNIGGIALLVKDYDEAIAYFTQKLNFKLLEDTKRSETKRWVRIAPKGDDQVTILLAKAKNKTQEAFIGNQTGGRVFMFLYTDDFWRDYNNMKAKGVDFIDEPRDEDYGFVIVFRDLYGNKWDFIQKK